MAKESKPASDDVKSAMKRRKSGALKSGGVVSRQKARNKVSR
jgi:Family of unknown function (DUF6496)